MQRKAPVITYASDSMITRTVVPAHMKEIWFAGGCFWGTEKLFKMIKGVTSTETGYANGDASVSPTYKLVCSNRTGYKEAVHVVYDPELVSLDYLVCSFYLSIDPTLVNRQGNDRGTQYQAGVFWNDHDSEETVRRISEEVEHGCGEFHVLLEELKVFVRAEDHHQDYLGRNPYGYCHVSPDVYDAVEKGTAEVVFGTRYRIGSSGMLHPDT